MASAKADCSFAVPPSFRNRSLGFEVGGARGDLAKLKALCTDQKGDRGPRPIMIPLNVRMDRPSSPAGTGLRRNRRLVREAGAAIIFVGINIPRLPRFESLSNACNRP